MADERTTYLADQVGRILIAAMDRDPESVAGCFGDVGDRYGDDGVYGVCCALASVVHTLVFPQLKRGDGSLAGDMLAIEKLPGGSDDPHSLWAARFVAAFVNGDDSTTVALFYGTLDTDQDITMGGVAGLVRMAGDVARHTEQHGDTNPGDGS